MADESRLPWERQENEPRHWFDRFDRYAKSLGAEYSVKRAYSLFLADNPDNKDQTSQEALALWAQNAGLYEWAARASAWADEERAVTAAMWRRRKVDLLEKDWQQGERLRGLAQSLIEKFVNELNSNDPQIKLNLSQIATAAKVASDLSRLAAAEPTSIAGKANLKTNLYLPTIDGEEAAGGRKNKKQKSTLAEDWIASGIDSDSERES